MTTLDPVLQAQNNLKEAERQYAQAQVRFKSGEITQSRVEQLGRLRDAAVEDLRRTLKEFGPKIPDEERWQGNFRPA